MMQGRLCIPLALEWDAAYSEASKRAIGRLNSASSPGSLTTSATREYALRCPDTSLQIPFIHSLCPAIC